MATTIIKATGSVANPRFMSPPPPDVAVTPDQAWFATRSKMTPVDEDGYSPLEPVDGDTYPSFGLDGGNYYARMNGSSDSLLIPAAGGDSGEFSLAIVGKWRIEPTKNEVLFTAPGYTNFTVYLPANSTQLTHFGNTMTINRTKRNLFLYSYFKNTSGVYERRLSVYGVGEMGTISTSSMAFAYPLRLGRNMGDTYGAGATFDLQYVALWNRGMDATERNSVRASLAASFGISA